MPLTSIAMRYEIYEFSKGKAVQKESDNYVETVYYMTVISGYALSISLQQNG